jgi:hypothetical protein
MDEWDLCDDSNKVNKVIREMDLDTKKGFHCSEKIKANIYFCW